MTDNKELEKLQAASVKELLIYFRGGKAVRESTDAIRDARLAISSLTAVGRIKATIRVGDGTQLAVLQSIATDREELRNFVGQSLPHLMPKKLLTRPDNK